MLQNAAAPTVQINYNMCNLERKAVICRYWDLLEKSVYLNIFFKNLRLYLWETLRQEETVLFTGKPSAFEKVR